MKCYLLLPSEAIALRFVSLLNHTVEGLRRKTTLIKLFVQELLRNWTKTCGKMGIDIKYGHVRSVCFAEDQGITAQDDADCMPRKVFEECTKRGIEDKVCCC